MLKFCSQQVFIFVLLFILNQTLILLSGWIINLIYCYHILISVLLPKRQFEEYKEKFEQDKHKQTFLSKYIQIFGCIHYYKYEQLNMLEYLWIHTLTMQINDLLKN